MKRIVTIQDISCVGKCSLTVALPIISAMGIETAVIPTAVLSTHTAFSEFTFCDLTPEIRPITQHWSREKFHFDAIYTGYLGSFQQLELVSEFIDEFKRAENLIFVDPVMGDFGRLYSGFTPEFAKAMARLCGKADIIAPNLTEAAFMLGEDYLGSGYSREDIELTLRALCRLGAKTSVLTGISFSPDELGVMGYDSERDAFFSYFNRRINADYHGTGDVFASACVGALMNDLSVEESLKIAADYTALSIQETIDAPDGRWYGVQFESVIPQLLEMMSRAKCGQNATRCTN
ncbi:MAG: pyridoxamine kinase [Planctomycetia bacterium]|nr:pyridoxamine kinase [Planctomycetia bacterium]